MQRAVWHCRFQARISSGVAFGPGKAMVGPLGRRSASLAWAVVVGGVLAGAVAPPELAGAVAVTGCTVLLVGCALVVTGCTVPGSRGGVLGAAELEVLAGAMEPEALVVCMEPAAAVSASPPPPPQAARTRAVRSTAHFTGGTAKNIGKFL